MARDLAQKTILGLALSFAFSAGLTGLSSEAIAAGAATACMQSQIDVQNLHQSKNYLEMGGAGVPAQKQTLFIPGTTSKAVVMFHGYLASPDEMRDLAARINLKTGNAVYVPLIADFGDNEVVANHATIAAWQSSVSDAIELANGCFSELEVVGYSMGGGLLTDFLMHRSFPSISRVVLYSPYLLAHPFSLLLEPYVANELKTRDSLPVTDVTRLFGPELLSELMPGFTQNELIPLQSLAALLQMKSLFLRNAPGTSKLSVPTLIVYAEDDPLIDTRFIPIFAARHFSNVTYQVFPAGSGVLHQTLQRASLTDF